MLDLLDRHQRIALQFSGGKDSLAVLFLMRPHWERLTVYYLNSGDAFPETMRLIEHVSRMVPRFVEVQGRQPMAQREYGWPSDILTAGASRFAMAFGYSGPALIDRHDCCYLSIMKPMDERMKSDGVTLLIRGQRNADPVKPPLRSGDCIDGFELFYPIEDWSDAQVMAYLEREGAPIPPYYLEGLSSAPDCMHCTAWLEHKGYQYLARHHPEIARVVTDRLQQIVAAVRPAVDALDSIMETQRNNHEHA